MSQSWRIVCSEEQVHRTSRQASNSKYALLPTTRGSPVARLLRRSGGLLPCLAQSMLRGSHASTYAVIRLSTLRGRVVIRDVRLSSSCRNVLEEGPTAGSKVFFFVDGVKDPEVQLLVPMAHVPGATDLSVYTYMDCINRGDHMRVGTTSCFMMTSTVPCVQYVVCTLAEIDADVWSRQKQHKKNVANYEGRLERRMARCGSLLHCLARSMLKDAVAASYAVLKVELVDDRLQVLQTRTVSTKGADAKLVAAFDAERATRRTVNEFTHNVVLICDSTPNICLLNSVPWDIPGATDLATADYVERINCGQYMLVDFASLRAIFMIVGGVTPKAPDWGAAAPQPPATMFSASSSYSGHLM